MFPASEILITSPLTGLVFVTKSGLMRLYIERYFIYEALLVLADLNLLSSSFAYPDNSIICR